MSRRRPKVIETMNWIFVVNNFESIDEPRTWPHVKYCVWQHEVGKTTGTPHLQGYVMFTKKFRLTGLKKNIHPTANFRPRQGSHDQARDYCMKLDTRVAGPWELGKGPEQGKRNDLEAVKKLLDEGATLKKISEEYFSQYVRYSKGFTEYRRLHAAPRTEPPEVFVIIGPTGTGKSHFIRQHSPDAFWKAPGSTWFDDYDGTSDIVLDEFYGWLPYHFLLRLLDRYPLSVEVKNSHVNVNCKRIYITSNQHPTKWYKAMNYAPLQRRFTTFYVFETLTEHYVIESDGTKVLLINDV